MRGQRYYNRITICTIGILVLCISAYAQPVYIPDSNLRAAIADALQIDHPEPITQTDMMRLTRLNLYNKDIKTLQGLGHATNLRKLYINLNPISDLSPIITLTKLESLALWGIPGIDLTPLAHLTNLKYLDIAGCDVTDLTPLATLSQLLGLNARHNHISDLSPLAHLANLRDLDLSRNHITDISILGNLTNLVQLSLHHNRITNFAPLANLASLDLLEIHRNHSTDHTQLENLALSHFTYDQVCESPPLPLQPRLDNRTYPSVFYRWNNEPIANRPELSRISNLAHHDLRWGGTLFGLQFFQEPFGFSMAGDVTGAIQRRHELHALNPNMIHLISVGMRSATFDMFPEDSPFWIRDDNGNIFIEVYQGVPAPHGLLDFTKPEVQDRIVEQAIAVSKCGLYDGIMFDYWNEKGRVLGGFDGTQDRFFRTLSEEQQARDTILTRIRAQTRPDFIIIGNTNRTIIPRTAPYINGSFMETRVPYDKTNGNLERALRKTEDSLLWLDNNTREPRINALEGYTVPSEAPDSPTNLRWMRALTTLSLTHSDGYVIFEDSAAPGHYWYDFWDADLGRPLSEEKAQLYNEDILGLYIREYTNGWAVYNHSGSEQHITLPEEVQGVSSGMIGTEHTVANVDGEMYLRVKPKNPADVNGDGVVNILDLVVVAQGLGTDSLKGDVNGDGAVNVLDLVQVAGAIGGGEAAPSAYFPDLSMISATDVERWLALAQGSDIGDANFQRGIRFLQQLLAALTPKETSLLPNYPNPFNPETWIPYRLAREAEVAITIYDTKGTLVRRLALGNQAAGYYAAPGKAAYWDGRNEGGEAVASGIYIYQFRAGDYVASRRLVILK